MACLPFSSPSFLEECESLVVEADSATEPHAVRSRSRGFQVPGRSVAEAPRSAHPVFDLKQAVDALSGVLKEGRAVPGLWVEAVWVAFAQQVTIEDRGRPPVLDTRRGERVRLTARCVRGGRSGVATVESVLPGDLPGLTHEVARRAEERVDAGPAPEGPGTVVMAPGVGGIVAHELIGHALEADTVLAGGSWLAGFEGRPGSELGVVDDPRRCRVAWRVDDEGEQARPVTLVREGRVTGWLHDRATARATGAATTGHGRRASFREPVRPRMGCTFVQPGGQEPGELLEDVREGIYIRRMEAAGTDPLTGRAVFRVTDSDLVRAGRFDRPLLPHLLMLKGEELLHDTIRIANDLVFDRCIGSCHRDGQALSTSVGAPTICIGSAAVIV